MKNKHTPGPWHIVWNEAEGQAYIYGRDLNTLATVWLPIYKMEEAAANARVIAEAPALLALIKEQVDSMDNMNDLNYSGLDWLQRAQEALARVKGG